MKSGFISIIGRPNVGKSTLLNALLGEKIAITTDKPQTTRNRIRGIYTDEEAQMVFLDTPGIHKPRNKLGRYMTEEALTSVDDVDIVLFVVDDLLESGRGDAYILEAIRDAAVPKFLLINKIDKMAPEKYRKIFEEYDAMGIFDGIYGISAKEGINLPSLIAALKTRLPNGPAYFPEDAITDSPERFLVSEIIREKLLMYLSEEVPHGVAVEIESYEELPALTKIGAVIYCEKKSHKSIIIGKGGRKLKGIGKSAREDIQKLVGTKVYLSLWVRVKENWRDSDFMLSNFGYKEES
ncbi:MAG: GTPase Era [Eubacteriales bacterium]|nr:GTPase Era [Eubacteriales bacterium]